jgi:NMD protein affecting ribosome stability and mRNA decay
MKNPTRNSAGKGRIRSLSRKGVKTGKSATVGGKAPQQEPTVCERCGAVFAGRTWRRDHRLRESTLAAAVWIVCPACNQIDSKEYCGRVLARGAGVAAKEAAIHKRVNNVASRAEHTQPEHRLVSIERDGATIEILTTSQKLAHRIAHELKKAFGGTTSYAWSDRDGSLFATWSYSGSAGTSAKPALRRQGAARSAAKS